MLGTLAQFARQVRRPALAVVATAVMVLPAISTASGAVRGADVIADVAEKVIDAVVNISTSQKVETRNAPMPQLPNDPQLDELFRAPCLPLDFHPPLVVCRLGCVRSNSKNAAGRTRVSNFARGTMLNVPAAGIDHE